MFKLHTEHGINNKKFLREIMMLTFFYILPSVLKE